MAPELAAPAAIILRDASGHKTASAAALRIDWRKQ